MEGMFGNIASKQCYPVYKVNKTFTKQENKKKVHEVLFIKRKIRY